MQLVGAGGGSVSLLHTLSAAWLQLVEEKTRSAEPLRHFSTFGMSRPLYAFVFALASGASLPIGAFLGVQLSPVRDKTCAAMMAFGAGSLLFAVTVELYAHTLRELDRGNIGFIEMWIQTGGALAGAYTYLFINRWLEHSFHVPEVAHPGIDAMARSKLADESQLRASAALSVSYRAVVSGELQRAALEKQKMQDLTPKQKAHLMWGRVRAAIRLRQNWSFCLGQSKDSKRARSREKGMRALWNVLQEGRKATSAPSGLQQVDPETARKARMVAMALFLGLLVDGVPEGVLMGFLAAEGHLTPVLIISLLVANFPEAFSSASLLITGGFSTPAIVGLWAGLALLVGSLGGVSCWMLLAMYPNFGEPGVELPLPMLATISLVEGLTGGAMMACITSVMLPEAFERAGKDGWLTMSSGFLATCGFLLAVAMKATLG